METTPPPPNTWQCSTTRRFLNWLTSWRTVRRSLIVLACLATLAGLFYTVENWRGKRAWTQFKSRMEAKGERFDIASVVPRPVPDEQNFAMTPLLKPLLDYMVTNGATVWRDEQGIQRAEAVDIHLAMPEPNEGMWVPGMTDPAPRPSPPPANTRAPKLARWASGERTDLQAWQAFYQDNTNYPAPARPGTPATDVLVALSKFNAELAELRAAAERPHAVFPVHYEEGMETLLRHLAVLRKLTHLPAVRASALLELGQTDEALRDVELALRFGEVLKDEPMLISQLVRLANLKVALQPVWDGLVEGRWSEAQLRSLQTRLEKTRPLNNYPLAIRGENTIFIAQIFDRLRTARYNLADLSNGGSAPPTGIAYALTRAIPDGWFCQNQVVCSRLLLEHFLPVADVERQRVDPGAVRAGTAEVETLVVKRNPYNLLAGILLPAYGAVVERFAYAQTSVNLATVACALERHRLTQGQLPESLDALTPAILAKLPHDIISGQSLKYRRIKDGRFVLYSVGWNETDDGGEVVLTKDSSVDHSKGDWVWQYSAD